MEYKLNLDISNSSEKDLLIILEPWPEYYTLKPKENLNIVGEGGKEGSNFEIHYHGGYITIHSWAGSVSSVYQNGDLMQPGDQTTPD